MFLILAILTGVRWNRKVVLICVSLRTKDVERFKKKISLSHLYPLFWEAPVLFYSPHFNWCLGYLVFSFWVPCLLLRQTLCQMSDWKGLSCPICGLFSCLTVFMRCRSFVISQGPACWLLNPWSHSLGNQSPIRRSLYPEVHALLF